MRFVIAYDICEPGRLRRVARRLERSAVRVQKSIFVFAGTRGELESVTSDLACLIDVSEDRLQAWPVHDGPGIHGFEAGSSLPGRVAVAVLGPDGILTLEGAT